jgi:signal peptidase I
MQTPTQILAQATSLLRANLSLLAFILLMLVFRSAFADWMVVPTASMNPTIIEGDRVLVDKHVFGVRVPFTTVRLTEGDQPQRGDIVVFASPNSDMTLIKRVIGLPGDVVEMRDEHLLINHVELSYLPPAQNDGQDLMRQSQQETHVLAHEALPGRTHDVMVLPGRQALRNFGPTVVPAGHYFMMGDNRDNSEDSRFIGSIARDQIVGRASRVVLSLNPEHFYLPRGDRLMKPLS